MNEFKLKELQDELKNLNKAINCFCEMTPHVN